MPAPDGSARALAAGIIAAYLVTSAAAHASSAAPPWHVTVDCKLDARTGQLHGTVQLALSNPSGTSVDRVYLWLYPNRFARPAASLDDVTTAWLYPNRFDPGGMAIEAVDILGGDSLEPGSWRAEPHGGAGARVLWSIALPTPIEPGQSIQLHVRFRAHAPQRLGSFGCQDGHCTLAGGFYPMPAAIDRGGWDLLAPPARAALDITVALDRPASMVLFDRWSGNERARMRVRTIASYATLVVAPRHYVQRRPVRGARIRYLSPEPPPPADDARRVILPYTLEDYGKIALDTVEDAYDMLEALDARPATAPLTIVRAPLRFELAEVHGKVVLLSDRFYRIWPAERFRKFHRVVLAEAALASWYQQTRGPPGQTAAFDRLSLIEEAEVVAAWLAEVFESRRYRVREKLSGILRPVSFIPAIDQLLYAPQTMFADAYFGETERPGGADADIDVLRDHPVRFSHRRPRGRFIYHKLRDAWGTRRLAEVMPALLAERGSLTVAAGAEADEFFRQWLLPPARVNYVLGGYHSEPTGDGDYQHRIDIHRHIEDGHGGPVEPVTVLAIDEDGTKHRLRWWSLGNRGTVEYRSSSPIASVTIDPERRLFEHAIDTPAVHPRFDNTDHHPLRFVYNSFGVLFNVSDLSALLAADFTLARVHDLQNELRLVAFTSADVDIGGRISYRRGFGRPVTADRLLGRAALSVGGRRLDGSFFDAELDRDAWQMDVTASVGADTEVFVFHPLEKHSARLAASLVMLRRDATEDGGADWLTTVELGSRLAAAITPRIGHTLAGELGLAAVVGQIDSREQLLSAGGSDGIRGYGPGRLFGRALGRARAEWRHTFVSGLDWNFGHYTFVRSLGGVAFVDAGLLSPCDSYLPDGAGSVYSAAGYGLMALYDSFGTLPAMMRLDAAVQMSGAHRSCLGQDIEQGPQVQIYLSFVPPF